MKRLSITLRITLWYALVMLLIVLLMFGFMLTISNSVVESNARDRLQTVVDYNVDEVEYDDGEIEIDKDFQPFKNGVSSLVYASDFAWVAGQLPGGFPQDTAFVDGQARLVSAEGERYLVYDRMIASKKHPEIWVRGVLQLDVAGTIAGSLLRIALFTLPFLLILAIAGGYWVTHKAFRPVRAINQAVESITEGRDLSRRIAMEAGGDEIHALAANFNGMLQRLESAFEAEKQFVSDASHELRTPVSVILAQCEYALGQDQSDEEARDSLRVVRRQAERMHRLIAHLLTITRLEQGNLQASLQDADVSALVGSLMEDAAILAPEHIALRQEVPAGIRAKIDVALFTRLFQNLLQNAMKYGKQSVAVTLRAQDGKVLLTVADDGIGIAPEEQDRIWRRLYQVNPSRVADETESMGLGLAIAKQIALLHHGDIAVQSKLGEGSAFTFAFPQK